MWRLTWKQDGRLWLHVVCWAAEWMDLHVWAANVRQVCCKGFKKQTKHIIFKNAGEKKTLSEPCENRGKQVFDELQPCSWLSCLTWLNSVVEMTQSASQVRKTPVRVGAIYRTDRSLCHSGGSWNGGRQMVLAAVWPVSGGGSEKKAGVEIDSSGLGRSSGCVFTHLMIGRCAQFIQSMCWNILFLIIHKWPCWCERTDGGCCESCSVWCNGAWSWGWEYVDTRWHLHNIADQRGY